MFLSGNFVHNLAPPVEVHGSILPPSTVNMHSIQMVVMSYWLCRVSIIQSILGNANVIVYKHMEY